MVATYTTTEARARFSEAIRRAREGETVTITYRGEPVAEIKPIKRKASADGGGNPNQTIEERLDEMRREGTLVPSGYPKKPWSEIKPIHAPGALNRFLADRWGVSEEEAGRIRRGESLGPWEKPNPPLDEREERGE